MSTQVTLDLPDETYQRAKQFAAYANRDISEIIAASLASTLPPFETIEELQAISKLSDAELLKMAESKLTADVDRRLSELLNSQQAGTIGNLEKAELGALMRAYEIGLMQQSQALAEAVHRGLLPPMQQ